MRTLAATIAFVLALGVGIAVAAGLSDDENDYEGRAAGQDTYFGFDLANNGNKVKNITASLHYFCAPGMEGTLLVETDGALKVDEDGKFEGKTGAESKGFVTYKTSGQFGSHGKAAGTIKAKTELEPGVVCQATNDGDWSAKKGRDIDVVPR
jgi:hypothetical protein